MVCNPGNPTGSVYSDEQLRALLSAARDIGAVVIADEVYADIVWADGCGFTPMAALSEDVPVLSVGAVSKRFLVPGWRCGWLLVHDRGHTLRSAGICTAMQQSAPQPPAPYARLLPSPAPVAVSQFTIGPTVCVQAAVPKLFASTPRGWHDAVCASYRTASNVCCLGAASSPGMLVEARPKGAMYLLVRVQLERFQGAMAASDAAWCSALMAEEHVMLLPGSAFGAPGCVRMVLCAPEAVLETAWARIEAFCKRHLRKQAAQPAGPTLLWDSNLTTGMM